MQMNNFVLSSNNSRELFGADACLFLARNSIISNWSFDLSNAFDGWETSHFCSHFWNQSLFILLTQSSFIVSKIAKNTISDKSNNDLLIAQFICIDDER